MSLTGLPKQSVWLIQAKAYDAVAEFVQQLKLTDWVNVCRLTFALFGFLSGRIKIQTQIPHQLGKRLVDGCVVVPLYTVLNSRSEVAAIIPSAKLTPNSRYKLNSSTMGGSGREGMKNICLRFMAKSLCPYGTTKRPT